MHESELVILCIIKPVIVVPNYSFIFQQTVWPRQWLHLYLFTHFCLIVSINLCDQTTPALTLMLLVNTVKKSPPPPPQRTAVTPADSSYLINTGRPMHRGPMWPLHTLSLSHCHTHISASDLPQRASTFPDECVCDPLNLFTCRVRGVQQWGVTGVTAHWGLFSGLDWLIQGDGH